MKKLLLMPLFLISFHTKNMVTNNASCDIVTSYEYTNYEYTNFEEKGVLYLTAPKNKARPIDKNKFSEKLLTLLQQGSQLRCTIKNKEYLAKMGPTNEIFLRRIKKEISRSPDCSALCNLYWYLAQSHRCPLCNSPFGREKQEPDFNQSGIFYPCSEEDCPYFIKLTGPEFRGTQKIEATHS